MRDDGDGEDEDEDVREHVCESRGFVHGVYVRKAACQLGGFRALVDEKGEWFVYLDLGGSWLLSFASFSLCTPSSFSYVLGDKRWRGIPLTQLSETGLHIGRLWRREC